jgi:hypothetical protein
MSNRARKSTPWKMADRRIDPLRLNMDPISLKVKGQRLKAKGTAPTASIITQHGEQILSLHPVANPFTFSFCLGLRH